MSSFFDIKADNGETVIGSGTHQSSALLTLVTNPDEPKGIFPPHAGTASFIGSPVDSLTVWDESEQTYNIFGTPEGVGGGVWRRQAFNDRPQFLANGTGAPVVFDLLGGNFGQLLLGSAETLEAPQSATAGDVFKLLVHQTGAGGFVLTLPGTFLLEGGTYNQTMVAGSVDLLEGLNVGDGEWYVKQYLNFS